MSTETLKRIMPLVDQSSVASMERWLISNEIGLKSNHPEAWPEVKKMVLAQIKRAKRADKRNKGTEYRARIHEH